MTGSPPALPPAKAGRERHRKGNTDFLREREISIRSKNIPAGCLMGSRNSSHSVKQGQLPDMAIKITISGNIDVDCIHHGD
jgi:hypothetical protein